MKYRYFFVVSFSMRNLYVENCRIKIYAHEQIKKLKKIIYEKDVTETKDDDGINYVVRSKYNNGVKYKVEKNNDFKINPAKTISFGAENRDFFYQIEEYITGNKMYYIDTSEIDEYACLFFINVLQKTFNERYSFSDGMIPSQIYDKEIQLPIDESGNPDWDYMSKFMKKIEKIAKTRIDFFTEVL